MTTGCQLRAPTISCPVTFTNFNFNKRNDLKRTSGLLYKLLSKNSNNFLKLFILGLCVIRLFYDHRTSDSPCFLRSKTCATAGNRTRIHCLEGNDANHYTTDACASVAVFSITNDTDILIERLFDGVSVCHLSAGRINTDYLAVSVATTST